MSKNNKTAKKNTAAATSSAPEPVTVLVTAKHTKKNCRATLQYTQTRICRATKGAWKQDAYYGRPLNELEEKGAFKLANKRAKELFDEFYANVDPETAAAEPDWLDAINDFECLKNAAAEAAPAEPEAPAGEALQDDDDLNVVEAPAEQPEEEYWAELEATREEAREQELAEAAAAIEPDEEPEAGEDERLAEFEAALEKARFNEEAPAEEQEAPATGEARPAKAEAKAKRPAPCQVILPGGTGPQPIPADIELVPGTRLVRHFKGETYEVNVTEAGFEWNGETYPTLTHISWKIPPYKQGGTTFFGIPAKRRNTKH